MTEGKKWMLNLPAFPVALEQAFQCSWHFRFQVATNVFLLLWKTNLILAFTAVLTVSDEKPSNTRYVWTFFLFRNSFALCFRGLAAILFTSMTISQSFTFKQYFLNTLFLLDWYDCDKEQAWKEIQRCSNRSHFRFTARLLRPFHSIVSISSLWNARQSSHSRFIGKCISSWLADRLLFQYLWLFSDSIILVIWLNKFIHNVFRYCACVLACACCVSPSCLMTSSLVNIIPTPFRKDPSPLRRLPTTPEPRSQIFPISPNNRSTYPLDQSEGSKDNRPPI